MSKISAVRKLGVVPFPAFTGERVYMQPFDPRRALPAHLARWQATVDAMLCGTPVSDVAYLMVDQQPVRAGASQRRPGVHVDMYWHAEDRGQGLHRPWPRPGHRSVPSPHASAQEAIVLAADVLGCAAYVGRYDAAPREGGACSHVDTSEMERVDLEPGYAWAGHTMYLLHESLPVSRDCLRTVVRLNIPSWAPVEGEAQ